VSIEPFGVLTIICGLLVLVSAPALAIYLLIISTLFGAAGAVTLTSLGSANLPPSHLLLGFIVIKFLLERKWIALALESLVFPRGGFWLLFTVVYGAASAYLMPRLFQGATDVFAISRSDSAANTILLALAPVSGNVTQTIYLIGDFICFLIFYAYAREPRMIVVLCHAAIACAIANLAFAVIDLVTYWTGTADLLTFLRNASYRMLDDVEVMGFKRIVGSFTEASAYAFATLGLFAFTGKLWLRGIYSWLTGPIAGLSLVALLASTSSTAYVSLVLLLAAEYAICVTQLIAGRSCRTAAAFVVLAPILAATLMLFLVLQEDTWLFVQDLVNKTVFDKLASSSGTERSSMNTQALINFFDTYGLGVGVGSTRTSSFLLVVPASVGVLGSLIYTAFMVCLLKASPAGADWFAASTRAACQSACMSFLIAGSLAGGSMDLGLPFFIFAGLVSGIAELEGTATIASVALSPFRASAL
jgi:hypothetical protein